MPQECQRDLVYDIGGHTGQDSDFYLKLGYRVVAVEASPDMAARLHDRFRDEVTQGRMVIVNKAIAEQPGEITFYVNRKVSDWSTANPAWAERNRALGAESEEITVEAVPLAEIMREHGCPWYIKIDIEGADMLCVRQLAQASQRPEYLSIESNKVSWAGLVEEFDELTRLGYTRFQVVDQKKHPSGMFRTRDGAEVDYRFILGSSGPFGEYLDGPWLTREQALRRYRWIFLCYRLFGDNTLLERVLPRIPLARRLMRLVSWYDTHARRTA
jgi:FkbM family methyltransferase